jgi:hypothetical protein
VLTGTVRFASGEPAPDLEVRLKRWVAIGGTRQLRDLPGDSGRLTDDRGVYRHFGLAAGEYVIQVSPRSYGDQGLPSARVTTAADVRWAESVLRGDRAGAGQAQNIASVPPGTSTGYAVVYHPGTTSRGDATTVAIAAGEERSGLDITVSLVPTNRVSGRVVGPDGSAPTGVPQIYLVAADGANDAGYLGIKSTAGAEFTFDGIVSGSYALTATLPATKQWATGRVTVAGTDVTGVALELSPGLTASGRIVVDPQTVAAPPDTMPRASVALQPVASGGGLTLGRPQTTSGADGMFSVDGLMPGQYRVSISLPSAGAWSVASATLDGRDVLDTPLTIEAGRDVRNIVVTLSGTPTELTGRLEDATGRPAPEYYIVVFPDDQAFWVPQSRRIQAVRPGVDGRFVVRHLPAGAYRVAALTDVERDEWFDRTFLEGLLSASVAITLGPGERKVQDFRLGGR